MVTLIKSLFLVQLLYSIESVSSVKLSYYTNNKGKGVLQSFLLFPFFSGGTLALPGLKKVLLFRLGSG